MTKCEAGSRYGFPTVNIEVSAGNTCEMRCGETSKGSNQAEVIVTEMPTTVE